MPEGTTAQPDGPAQPDVPVLSRTAHDRAALRRHDEKWLTEAWPTARVLLLAADGTTPVRRGGRGGVDGSDDGPVGGSAASSDDGGGGGRVELAFVDAGDVDPAAPRMLLGETADAIYFTVAAEPTRHPGEWLGLRSIGGELDDLGAGLLTAAVALTNWHDRHTHCPRCGAATEIVEAGWARRCPVDDSQHFPRTDPAVIMLVHDGGDRCVLGRQASWGTARFSILAGFVEAGESAEAAVAREVYEEVGLHVTDIAYRASQPWPFPASLMLGFVARAEGDLTIRRHDNELADAGWFSRAEVRAAATWENDHPELDGAGAPGSRLGALPGGISIARQLIEAWLQE